MATTKYAPSLSIWPVWAQGAFAYANVHPVAKALPAARGALAVAVYLSVANSLPWATAFAYGMHAYALAMLAHLRAGGTAPAYKHGATLTATSTVAQVQAALAKTGFACTVAVANGMLGTIANATKAGTALAFAPLATTAAPVAYAKGAATVANAYNGVPAHQPASPANTTLAKVALPTLPA